jgi:hypothetical protein
MQLETNSIGGEGTAGQSHPIDRALSFLDPLLRRAPLIVEGDDPLGGRARLVTMKPTRG